MEVSHGANTDFQDRKNTSLTEKSMTVFCRFITWIIGHRGTEALRYMKNKVLCNADPKYFSDHVHRRKLRINMSIYSACECFMNRTG